jgi:hypothetical protein
METGKIIFTLVLTGAVAAHALELEAADNVLLDNRLLAPEAHAEVGSGDFMQVIAYGHAAVGQHVSLTGSASLAPLPLFTIERGS